MSNLESEKKALMPLLHTALTLELSTIPPYLTAVLSLKPKTNRVAAELIHSVMMEEMLHMVMVGNLISSLGGMVEFNKDNIPSYPLALEFEGKKFREREIAVNLEPFSPEAMTTFMQIEMPTDLITPEVQARGVPEIEVPGISIGEFYELVETKLTELCDQYPECNVFNGNPEHQINKNFYWGAGGTPVVITNLASAKEAINVIVEQGEGSHSSLFDGDKHNFEQPLEVAHYFRFKEISYGRHYKKTDHPNEAPTGKQFDVDYKAVYPIRINATAEGYQNDDQMKQLNNKFNRNYSLMLRQIAEAFNGNPEVLYTAIVNGMHNLTPLAVEMMETPIKGDSEGRNGAPSFEWAGTY